MWTIASFYIDIGAFVCLKAKCRSVFEFKGNVQLYFS